MPSTFTIRLSKKKKEKTRSFYPIKTSLNPRQKNSSDNKFQSKNDNSTDRKGLFGQSNLSPPNSYTDEIYLSHHNWPRRWKHFFQYNSHQLPTHFPPYDLYILGASISQGGF